MNLDAIKSAYRRYARFYDFIFGPVFHPGRRSVVDSLQCEAGDSILEVGVGTGLSLPLYPEYVKVTGIDVSAEMLDKARERVAGGDLPQVAEVLEMDAEDMNFADNSFDKVVAMYVVSVVPDPQRLVAEMRRVCKPGGDIFIVNHFRSRNLLLGTSERLLAPLSKLAGFRPDMDLDQFVAATGLNVRDVYNANLFGYWKVLRCTNAVEKAIIA